MSKFQKTKNILFNSYLYIFITKKMKIEIDKKFEKKIGENTYWLTRIVYLRAIGTIYSVAFLVAFQQNGALIGAGGLTPANRYLKLAQKAQKNHFWSMMVETPTLFWLINWETGNNSKKLFFLKIFILSRLETQVK